MGRQESFESEHAAFELGQIALAVNKLWVMVQVLAAVTAESQRSGSSATLLAEAKKLIDQVEAKHAAVRG